jgi:hypothetical protein
MRRSICYCTPPVALAGDVGSWTFTYTTSTGLPKGTKLKFDLASKGRDIDWEVPTANLKAGKNVIYGLLENGKVLSAKEVENPDSFTPNFEFVLPSEIPVGGSFAIRVGAPKENSKMSKTHGNRAQTDSQRRRPFNLYIDTSGKGRYTEPEVFSMDIKGNELNNISVLAPSFIVRNKRFNVIVRFEDLYGNLTSETEPDTLIELSHEHLRENLNWKLFVPETGFISLPNLYFNEPGVYTIALRNTKTKEVFRSAPIRCFAENNKSLFWGLLHGESERIDSTENIEDCLRYFRDDKAMNFFASSPFESAEETSNDIWKLVCQNLVDFDEPDRFTAIIGFQWHGVPGEEGIRQIVYSKENRNILRKKDAKYSSLKKIYKSFAPKELLSIPCFTMGKGLDYDFKNYNPDFERVVEIYNAWGSSECIKKEGNKYPIEPEGKNGVKETVEGSIQKALQNNCRFGFVAGGLDDRGVYTDLFEGEQKQYTPGLTAIIAAEHSRAALIEALYNRSCYATTGQRIILGITLASLGMGSETSTALKHGLLYNRHFHGFVAGTTNLVSIELIRNGKVIHTYNPEGYSYDFSYDDLIPLEKVVIDAKDGKPPFAYYYIRVTQADGHMAWSSPIWVDYVPGSATGKSTVKLRAAGKASKSILPIDMDEDDEAEEEDTLYEED